MDKPTASPADTASDEWSEHPRTFSCRPNNKHRGQFREQPSVDDTCDTCGQRHGGDDPECDGLDGPDDVIRYDRDPRPLRGLADDATDDDLDDMAEAQATGGSSR